MSFELYPFLVCTAYSITELCTKGITKELDKTFLHSQLYQERWGEDGWRGCEKRGEGRGEDEELFELVKTEWYNNVRLYTRDLIT